MQLMIAAGFSIVATAEIFLQPYVKADKEIAAAHLFNFQLRTSSAAVTPGDWDHRPRITTNDCFKRQLDREIEMRRNQGTAAIEYSFAVSFESVRGVVQSDVE